MKPVVSKRNHFQPCAELVDDALMRIPDELKHPGLEKWLIHYTETVVMNIASHFGLGAQRGIEQTAQLLCDPDFYEQRRRTRRKQMKEFRDEMARQEWEREQKRNCPTAEQITEQLRWCDSQLVYHETQARNYREKILALHAKVPMDIEKRASRTTQ
jgi:hypothetical protein